MAAPPDRHEQHEHRGVGERRHPDRNVTLAHWAILADVLGRRPIQASRLASPLDDEHPRRQRTRGDDRDRRPARCSSSCAPRSPTPTSTRSRPKATAPPTNSSCRSSVAPAPTTRCCRKKPPTTPPGSPRRASGSSIRSTAHASTAKGASDWAVHVALVIDGVVVASAVALPGLGVTLTADPPSVLAPPHDGGPRLVVSRTRPPAIAEQVATALGGELVPLGSAGAKAMAVVRGEADIYLHSGGQYEWDSAAPVGVAAAAGLHTSRIDGSPLRYNQENPWLPDLLICRPELAGLGARARERRRERLISARPIGFHLWISGDCGSFSQWSTRAGSPVPPRRCSCRSRQSRRRCASWRKSSALPCSTASAAASCSRRPARHSSGPHARCCATSRSARPRSRRSPGSSPAASTCARSRPSPSTRWRRSSARSGSRIPGVTLALADPDDSADLVHLVSTGACELGVDAQPAPGRLESRELASQDLLAVFPPGTLAPRGAIGIDRLAEFSLVTSPEGTSTRRLLDDACASAGVTPRIAVVTEQREAILPLVLAGRGRDAARPSARRDRAAARCRDRAAATAREPHCVRALACRPALPRRAGLPRHRRRLSHGARQLALAHGQARGLPRLETADEIGRAVQPDVLQARGREARRVALVAHDDDLESRDSSPRECARRLPGRGATRARCARRSRRPGSRRRRTRCATGRVSTSNAPRVDCTRRLLGRHTCETRTGLSEAIVDRSTRQAPPASGLDACASSRWLATTSPGRGVVKELHRRQRRRVHVDARRRLG